MWDIVAAIESSSSTAEAVYIDADGVLLDTQDTEVLYHCRVAKLQDRLNILTQVR